MNRYRVSRLASRFWDITRGQIKVGGMDISKIDPKTLSLSIQSYFRMSRCLITPLWKISESVNRMQRMKK